MSIDRSAVALADRAAASGKCAPEGFDRISSELRRAVQRRTPVLEPLALIATVSLLTSWGIQPFVVQALTHQGAIAQAAAQAALWLSAVLSPLAALGKATAAALVCWAIAIYLDERLSFMKLVSTFCVAETLFSLRDLAMWGTLAIRGVNGIHSTADLLVPFGLNAVLHSHSALTRIAFESWDLFHLAWGLLVFWMIHAVFKTGLRSSACLAIVAFSSRVLFAAASLLYAI